MSLNPFAQVKDYHSMLIRLAWFCAASGSLATLVIRRNFPVIEKSLSPLDLVVELPGVKAPILGYILPGAAIALLAFAVKLHNKLSDMLSVRATFDVDHILLPMLQRAGVNMAVVDRARVEVLRRQLMDRLFYKYTSSTSPKVDTHLIYQALDCWSWYWVIAEAVFVWTLVCVVLLLGGELVTAILVACPVLFCVWVVAPSIKKHCVECAASEIEAILAFEGGQGKKDVVAGFNEIYS